ncbi:LutC/YkgG family protein [Marseilla massiliensis]|uniref:LUD domain-containing protein n=1 Tax=Marseilla massiliensis TaxID=1841864 RepID=A0A938WTZ4_9BACT|nr:LUD domain-containing protein [Marseilla massiliensis]MBM6674099.1 LUD domain-containing protein [Marseilla massiliensis]
MSTKEHILSRYRKNINVGEQYDMPNLDALQGVTYTDPVAQFISMSNTVGAKIAELEKDADINGLIKRLYPEAKVFASNMAEITIATLNPDTVGTAQELNGTDVGIVRGELGVAENGCVWIPQTMKERSVCFISEYLVIVLSRRAIVSNMHQAYARINMTDYGYGTFISGPSKTADIAQALVMGAQAARGVTVILTD